jgi:hypothetical protein
MNHSVATTPAEVLRSVDAASPRWLGGIALAIGFAWTMAILWAWGGMREGGDSADYLARVDMLRQAGLPALALEQNFPAHVTTIWMWMMGQTGFVTMVVLLTALLPWIVLSIVRAAQTSPACAITALALIAVNPELYKWAWFILTDGAFLILVALLVGLLARPSGSWWWSVGLFVLAYHAINLRPTGTLLFPGLIAYGVLLPERVVRRRVLGITAMLALWSVGWLVATGATAAKHETIAREGLVGGYLLQDPRMIDPVPVPFTVDQVKGLSAQEICRGYPAYCFTFHVRKLSMFYVPVFPRYSLRHNVFNALYFGLLVSLTLFGLVRTVRLVRHGMLRARDTRTAWARTTILCLTCVMTAGLFHTATHVDSDARFLIVWVPLWICAAVLLAFGSPDGPHESPARL